uniref:CdiI n=5 Tax=Pseudomonas TaxID=286 RepID=A0A4V1E898_PSEAI|nr:CdiIo1 [Pseudomonas aeruginosa]QCO92187.1 CdiI [Pseudomonas aeruginosa]QCO92573.1 CdiI [Pseudomonas aeruginosa]QCO92654.1 CdiI [Pseudomonas aeruginosa]QCO92662.1 CdiI [Pseudomonas aeruginosa]
MIMKLERNPDFEILRSSDVRYEHLTTEVQYKGEPVAQINQDKGKENLELEIFADLKDAVLRVPLDDFLESLRLARNSLLSND